MLNSTHVKFVQALENLRAQYAFSVTSWYRTSKHNQAVGGKATSKHLVGLAADCVLDSPKLAREFIGAARMQNLLALDEKDHIHVQVMLGEEARQIFAEILADPVEVPAKAQEEIT